MPFLLNGDGVPLSTVNRWLRSLPTTGVPAASSWQAYARDLVAWVRFLDRRGLEVVGDPAGLAEAVAAYHGERRAGELERRLSKASWNRAVARTRAPGP